MIRALPAFFCFITRKQQNVDWANAGRVLIERKDVSPMTGDSLANHAAPDFMEFGEPPETLIYKTAHGKDLKLLCVKPLDWKESDRRTAMLWIHGGGWCEGKPEIFIPHCRYFASRGAVAFSVEYRLLQCDNNTVQGSVRLEDCLKDCKSAVRFVRKNAAWLGIDIEKVVVAGDSAGGHLACCLATIAGYSDETDDLKFSAIPDAVIDCNGIPDMTQYWKRFISFEQDTAESEVEKWFVRYAKAKTLSPYHSIHEGQPPMFVQHGMRDHIVPAEEAFKFYEAYRLVGNIADFKIYRECEHAFILFHYTASSEMVMRAIRDVDTFLTELAFLAGGSNDGKANAE